MEIKKTIKTLFFYTTWDFSGEESDGIARKIRSQMRVFEQKGYSITYSYIKDNGAYMQTNEQCVFLGKVGIARKLLANYYISKVVKNQKFDTVYIRYSFADFYFVKSLKNLRDNCSKIILEIPTYPYEKELCINPFYLVLLVLDKIFRSFLHRYVDRVVTYSDDKEIFHIPTIITTNGIDIKRIKRRDIEIPKKGIQMIAVAGLATWHGYDRMIEGIGKYYQAGGKEHIVFHMVGDGKLLAYYKKLVEQYGIEKNVIFYGFLFGEKLDEIYNKCNLAVASLAIHRIKLKKISTLKGIEYGAKGLPVITSTEIKEFHGMKYQLLVPEDETSIEVEKIIQFLSKLGNEFFSANSIYETISEYGDMQYTFREILDYVES